MPLPAPVWVCHRDVYDRRTWERGVLYEWAKDQQGRWIARVARVEALPNTSGRWYQAGEVRQRDPDDGRYQLNWLTGDA